jgi:tetratricopeptide (TPR) repeat protein
MLVESSESSGIDRHFTISYAGFNRPWAAWIAHQLAWRGVDSTLLRWDPDVSTPLTAAFEDLLLGGGRVLLVLDDWYFRLGPRTTEEWTSVLREVVVPRLDRFCAVSVANQAMPTTVAALRPVDLRDLDEAEAARLVLQRLGLPAVSRLQPAHDGGPKYPLDPPAVRNTPRRTQSFTGRDPILESLHEQLTSAGPAGARLALHGVGGVGKSAIAIEYAHRFGNHYDVVYWIDARFRASARETLAELAPRLGLKAGREIGARIRAVQEALRLGQPHRSWLLVFDGADSPEAIADLVPDGPGHVLFTTLNRVWVSRSGLTEVPVPPFIRAESIAYARRRASRLTSLEADLLADAVEDLPLMLAQTASWLNTNTMPVADYVGRIRRGDLARLGFGIDEDYPRGFQTAWAITLNTLREEHPSAAELLQLLARFSPDNIPVQLIHQARPGDLPRPLATLAENPISWHSALARIADSTALRLDYPTGASGDVNVGSARMHRLYHTFLRTELPEEENDAMSATACQVLVGADPRRPAERQEWAVYAELIPQLGPSGAMESKEPAVRELILNCIEYLKLRGEFTVGRELCEHVRRHWESALPSTHFHLLRLEYQYANLLRRSGRYRAAEAISRATLAKLSDRPGDDSELLLVNNGFGGTLLALAELDEAYTLYEGIWRHYRDKLGAEDPNTLQARGNLGLALGLLGRYEEALAVHGEVLAVRERLLSREHLRTLDAGVNYAWMLRLLGRYTEAVSRQTSNARLHQQVLADEDSPGTLRAEHNLAQCMRRNGDLDEASRLMLSVVERSQRIQGMKHPETLMVQADWSTFLRQRGELSEAAVLSRAVHENYRDLVGDEHPYTAGTLGNLGLVHRAFGEREDALRAGVASWQAMVQAVGEDHPWSLGCALNAAGARQDAGDQEGAVELSRVTLLRARAVLGTAHPLTFSCQAAFSADLRALHRTEEADKSEREVLDLLAASFGAEHPHTLAVRRRDRPYWDFEPQPI